MLHEQERKELQLHKRNRQDEGAMNERVNKSYSKDIKEVYKLIKNDSNILEDYIIPCYEPLHSQSKKYIVENINT